LYTQIPLLTQLPNFINNTPTRLACQDGEQWR